MLLHGLEVLLVVVVVVGVVLVARRVHLLRRGGSIVVLRGLPAPEGRGWRHGVLRYDEEALEFYRVASVRLGPDRRVARRRLTVADRRRARPAERDTVPPGSTVLLLDDGRGEVELALAGGSLTAFLAWVESSPPSRRDRGRPGTRRR